MANPDTIHITHNAGVLHIGLHRPDKKNALNPTMYAAIRHALIDADEDSAIRVILIHGTPEAFSSGNDLSDFETRDTNKPSPAAELLLVLHALRKPLVAAVTGLAIGIGSTLLLHCDLVYAAPDVRFRLPFVNLGLCPEAGSSLLLPLIAGHRRAAEALLLGDFFDTEHAIQLGLVNQIVAADQVLSYATEKAEQLAQQPPQAVLLTKQLLKQSSQQPLAERLQLEFKHFAELLNSDESKQARRRLSGQKKR